MFGSQKVLRKEEKNTNFFIFDFNMKNMKENKI